MVLKRILYDPETKGMFFGMISSITISVITLYIAQHYLVQKAATAASKKAIEDYKQEFGIMSAGDWKPYSEKEIANIKSMIDNI